MLEVNLAALARGKHVFSEKLLGVSVGGGWEDVRARMTPHASAHKEAYL